MKVKRITDMSDMLKLVPIEIKLRAKEKSNVRTKELLEFVQKMLPNPLFYPIVVYTDEAENIVAGYIMVNVIPDKVMDMQSINILRVWTDPHCKEVIGIFLDALKIIADQHNIHKMRIATRGRQRAINKRWGFEPIATVMERRI